MTVQNTQLSVPLDPRSNSLYSTVIYQFHNASYTSIPGLLRGRTRIQIPAPKDRTRHKCGNCSLQGCEPRRYGEWIPMVRKIATSSSSSTKQCQKNLFVPEDDGSTALRNVGSHSQSNRVSHPSNTTVRTLRAWLVLHSLIMLIQVQRITVRED
jgi:hypothetical protein